MKTKRWKVFMDYENEEKWLNEMAAKGFAMTAYNFCCYTFEDCAPGEYIYRIEALEHRPNHPENLRYIRFLEENGVEHVDTYHGWAYFRKKATDGNFNIYSDLDSRIKHYTRISHFDLLLSFILLCAYFPVFRSLILSLKYGPPWSINIAAFWFLNIVVLLFVLLMPALLLRLWWRYTKKIKHLKREREIRE